MSTRVWLPADEQHLRQVREAAGIDHIELSRRCLLSKLQVQELEGSGQSGQFYSESIKFTAGVRVLKALGAQPLAAPEPPPTEMLLAKPSAEPVQTIPERVSPNHDVQKKKTPLLPWQCGVGIKLAFLAAAALVGFYVYNVDTTHPAPASPSPAQQTEEPLPPPATQAPAPVSSPTKATTPEHSEAVVCGTALQSTTPVRFSPPAHVSKPGNYVHFVAKRPTTVCVEDAQGRVTTLELSKGETKSVYGPPPLKVWHSNATIVQMYYQGLKVSGRAAKAGVTFFQP